MREVEEIGHTEALQPLFGELNQRLGPVTDDREDLGSQGLEALIHQRFPRGIGPILCHLFQQQIARFYLKGARNPRRISNFMKKQCVASLTQLQNRYPLAQRIVHPLAA